MLVFLFWSQWFGVLDHILLGHDGYSQAPPIWRGSSLSDYRVMALTKPSFPPRLQKVMRVVHLAHVIQVIRQVCWDNVGSTRWQAEDVVSWRFALWFQGHHSCCQ